VINPSIGQDLGKKAMVFYWYCLVLDK